MRFVAVVLMATCACLYAQRPIDRPDPVLWEDGRLHVVEDGRVVVETQDGKAARHMATSRSASAYGVSSGKAWYSETRRGTTPTLPNGSITSLYRREESGWVLDAEFEYAKGFIVQLHPLGNGRYWAVTSTPGLFSDGDGASYPVAILSKGKGDKLRVHSVLDLGLDKPFFFKQRPPTAARATPYAALTWDILMPLVIRADGYLVLVLPDAGLLFVFDAETGQFKRKAQVYSSVTEELLTRPRELAPCVLVAHPTPSGKVLLSTRSEDAILQAARAFREHMPTINSDQDYIANRDKIAELHTLNLKVFPRVLWWTFDPANGSLHEELPPQHFPTLVQTVEELNAFRWRFKPDGNLLFMGRSTEPAAQSAQASTKGAPKISEKKNH